MDLPKKLVESLEKLTQAIAIYNRATFYYDPSYREGGDPLTIKDYSDVLAKIPVRVTSSTSELRQCGIVRAKTIEVYLESLDIISDTYHHLAEQHAEILKEFKRKADRDPEHALTSTEAHIDRAIQLIVVLTDRFQEEGAGKGWCTYRIEFNLLSECCQLVFDEIDFLKRQVTEIEESNHRRKNELHAQEAERAARASIDSAESSLVSARKSLRIAMWAIVVGTFSTWLTWGISRYRPDGVSAKESAPVELTIITTELHALNNKLAKVLDGVEAANENNHIYHREFSDAINDLRQSHKDSVPVSTVESLHALEHILADFILRISSIQFPRLDIDPAGGANKADQALASEIRALKESISSLKAAIEDIKHGDTIIKIEDSSRPKKGLFNLF